MSTEEGQCGIYPLQFSQKQHFFPAYRQKIIDSLLYFHECLTYLRGQCLYLYLLLQLLAIPELQKFDILIVNPIWPSKISYLFWNKYIVIHLYFPYSIPVFSICICPKHKKKYTLGLLKYLGRVGDAEAKTYLLTIQTSIYTEEYISTMFIREVKIFLLSAS